MSLTLVTPAVWPVTVDDAKANSRVSYDDDDFLIAGLISAATSYAERWCSQKFAPETWDYALDAFPSGSIELPLSPVTSVASISYVDSNDEAATIAGFALNSGRVSVSGEWPSGSSVVVRFTAGNGVPAAVRQAILLLVGHWYETRETASETAMAEAPMGAHTLLNLYRQMFV